MLNFTNMELSNNIMKYKDGRVGWTRRQRQLSTYSLWLLLVNQKVLKRYTMLQRLENRHLS